MLAVLLASTANDQVETLLLALSRRWFARPAAMPALVQRGGTPFYLTPVNGARSPRLQPGVQSTPFVGRPHRTCATPATGIRADLCRFCGQVPASGRLCAQRPACGLLTAAGRTGRSRDLAAVGTPPLIRFKTVIEGSAVHVLVSLVEETI
jgi:hypothetical protein